MPHHQVYARGSAVMLAMDYQVVLERDEASRHYTATVPGLPIVVDAATRRQAVRLVREAIGLYVEETREPRSQTVHAEVVTVKVSDAATRA